MRKSRFTAQQIVAVLKEAEAGIDVAGRLCKHGTSRATFYQWRSKSAGTTASEFKRMYADLAWETRPSRTSSNESRNAVREAPDGRPHGQGALAPGSSGLPSGRIVADGVVSAAGRCGGA